MVSIEKQMIQSATENRKSASSEPVTHPFSGLLRSASLLASDVIELGELQVALAKDDSRIAVRNSIFPGILLVFGLVALITGLPLLGFGLSSWLVETQGWSEWKAQLMTGALLIGVATLSILIGYFGLKAALKSFSRSSSELSKNLAWFKLLITTNHQDTNRSS